MFEEALFEEVAQHILVMASVKQRLVFVDVVWLLSMCVDTGGYVYLELGVEVFTVWFKVVKPSKPVIGLVSRSVFNIFRSIGFEVLKADKTEPGCKILIHTNFLNILYHMYLIIYILYDT
ncbi:hypothetical protein HanOQP8_Chr08g0293791 [Helianthus annuus]|nr:hypothetical protein HanIR_Chr08g0375271 [Helianthus annuus]KAJ0719841.1 hypothetical protein HanLR1_Chr08g0286281 [Helianthus annuus]KAJ0723068.1 hypothetical protein HanOQP8_Chr08g0293791 [Helianthus annuus]